VFKTTAEKVPPHSEENTLSKKYSRTKLVLSFLEYAVTLAYFLFLIFAGGSLWLGRVAEGWVPQTYGKLIVFTLLLFLLNGVLTAPVKFYANFIVDHRYGLSNQNFFQWLWEDLKGTLVGLVLTLPLLLVFYYCLHRWPVWWWLPVGTVFFFFSVALAKLAPVLIFPIFYKFSPIENEDLKSHIVSLCDRVGIRVREILSFNLSKTTEKANAALTGLGKTKRIILSDTLLKKFNLGEIEVIFAHELGHTYFGHIRKTLISGFIFTYAGLFLTAWSFRLTLPHLGFTCVDQIEALPLLFLYLLLFGLITTPLQNILSRYYERQADRFALELTGNAKDFVEAMNKLSEINLSDPRPNAVVEFLFYSHPSIEKRIEAALKFARKDYVEMAV